MQIFHTLSMWNQDISPSQYMDVFNNQEAPLSSGVQSFYWGFTV